MNLRNTIATAALAGLSIFTGGLLAQQTTQPTPTGTAQKMKAKMQGKMMGGGMMGEMMSQQNDISLLMTKLKESMAAIRSEKNQSALQTKLAEHSALLDQMQAKMSAQHATMEKMQKMMQSMMSSGDDKAAK